MVNYDPTDMVDELNRKVSTTMLNLTDDCQSNRISEPTYHKCIETIWSCVAGLVAEDFQEILDGIINQKGELMHSSLWMHGHTDELTCLVVKTCETGSFEVVFRFIPMEGEVKSGRKVFHEREDAVDEYWKLTAKLRQLGFILMVGEE